ncbi:hypothetical protein [Silvimonas soli]|uniref:hypothetical protein n=1 Tax=Silvimonas soli TaxID=2980100 RepID=UPI0024B397F1|nr:hypothetical protein [Silvimonas soli]
MQVLLIGTNHMQQADSLMFRQLCGVLQQLQPDHLLLEMRQEDIQQDSAMLAPFYGPEMILLAQQFRNIAHGFDWLGDAIVGKAIPPGHMDEQQALSADLGGDDLAPAGREFYSAFNAELEPFLRDDDLFIMNQPNAVAVAGRWINFYNWCTGRFAPLAAFYRKRVLQIDANIADFVQAKVHQPGSICVVIGLSHLPRVKAALQQRLPGVQTRLLGEVAPPSAVL